jgi:hypothetical protein
MNGPNSKLLVDLAHLGKKYKAKDWEELAACLDDPRQRERVRALLLELAEVSRTRRKPATRNGPKRSRVAATKKALERVRREDANRADLLDDIWLKMRQGELLPTLAALRVFAEAMGSKGLKSTRRDQAVTELMELLIKMPSDSLEQRMREVAVHDRELGDEYERWVQLILRRD